MKNKISKQVISQIHLQIKKDNIQKIVVGAVVVDEAGKILVLERIQDDFMGGLVELPSGGVDKGESIFEALEREVKEETGLKIESVDRYVGSFDYLSSSGKRTRQLNFVVAVDDAKVFLDSAEHLSFYFVCPGDAGFGVFNISDNTKQIIVCALG